MRLCAEILTRYLLDPEHEPFLCQLEEAVERYGITDLMVHGWNLSAWITFEAYPKVRHKPDQAAVNRLRAQLRRFTKLGVKICLSGSEPRLPSGFLDAYPDTRHVSNGQLWKFFESCTEEALNQFPEADSYEMYLWETGLMNDREFFHDFYWAPTMGATAVGTDRFQSPADYVGNLISACGRGAKRAGRQLLFLTFSHYPWQEKLLIEALRKVDRHLPIRLDHKCQPGDWTPHRPANNIMLEVTDRPAMMLFDGAGEYWGQCLMPYCNPQEIQQRLCHALEHNRSIDTLNMRVVWQHGHLFGTPNEINFYALSRFAQDPNLPIEDVWQDWAIERFGPAAAGRVISALRRSNRIANLFYYIRGVWIHNHSRVSDLPYLESHVLNFSKAQVEWTPWDFETRALLKELVDHPREHTIEWVLADREEALRLNELSLADIEAAEADLKPSDFELLHGQFMLQRRFIRASMPHIEAFLRYQIEKRSPSITNRGRLENALGRMEELAVEVEQEYGEQSPLLTASDIRAYVQQIRVATDLTSNNGAAVIAGA